MIKAIMFDLDGVLVDACEWHYHSLNDALDYYKGFRISYKDHISKFNGLPTSIKLEILGIFGEEKKNIWKMKQEKTLEKINSQSHRDKYKIKMLKQLKKEGYKLACVTNSIRKTATAMLDSTGQLQLFDVLIANEDVEHNKPSPNCYLLAMSMLKVEKTECLIVEDSPKGRLAAHASGAKVLEVEDVYDVTLDRIKREL